MAIRYETLFVVVPIEKNWFDVRIVREDKCICVYGKDKNDPGSSWVEVGDYKNYDELVVMGCAYEVSRDDQTFDQLIGEGLDDDGNRYLIIDRRENFRGIKKTMDEKKLDIWLYLEDFDNAELSEYDWMENMIEKVRDYNEEFGVNYDPKRTVENYLERKKYQDK